MRPKTIEAYSLAVRRAGEYFGYQIDALTVQQLTDYFADLLESYSWSTVKRAHQRPDGPDFNRLGGREMIRLASVIETFEADFLQRHADGLLPGQRQALESIKNCRSAMSPKMQAECLGCGQTIVVPHYCGHRNCPHCQNELSTKITNNSFANHLAKLVLGVPSGSAKH